MPTQKFHIGDILTITTGCLVSNRHVDGAYEILNFMTGANLFTHQLPRAAEICKPNLLEQHPQLAGIVFPEELSGNKEGIKWWVAFQGGVYGEYFEVEALDDGLYEHKNPVREISEMLANRRGL